MARTGPQLMQALRQQLENRAMSRPDGQPEDVDAAREHVRERIERTGDPFLGAAVDDDEM